MTDKYRDDAINGKTIRWTFTDGPVQGSTFEHTFDEDGIVVWRVVEGPAKGEAAREKEYSALKVADEVYAVSYLGAKGYTLTVVLNLKDNNLVGFASNDKEWYPLRGTFEMLGKSKSGAV